MPRSWTNVAMETDTSRLLTGDDAEESENQQLKDLVLFYGKVGMYRGAAGDDVTVMTSRGSQG